MSIITVQGQSWSDRELYNYVCPWVNNEVSSIYHILASELGKGSKKKGKKYGLLPYPPRTSPPPRMVFFSGNQFTLIFLSEIRPLMGETNFMLDPISKIKFFGLLFYWIRVTQATFKAVLMAVYMTKALQTKCKTCFGGPRMILHAH